MKVTNNDKEIILLKDVMKNLSEDSMIYISDDMKKINTGIYANSLDFQVAFHPKTLCAKVYENKEVIAFRIGTPYVLSLLIGERTQVTVVLKDCEV